MPEYPYIQTDNNDQITITSIGISGIDGLLRFWIDDSDLLEMMRIFTNQNALPITLYEDPEIEPKEYTDFTVLFGVEKDYNDQVMVVVGKP